MYIKSGRINSIFSLEVAKEFKAEGTAILLPTPGIFMTDREAIQPAH